VVAPGARAGGRIPPLRAGPGSLLGVPDSPYVLLASLDLPGSEADPITANLIDNGSVGQTISSPAVVLPT
jgi:hypothetical protein